MGCCRTGTYYAAILENRVDFEGKVVGDIGAGSGILSLFAAQVRPAACRRDHAEAPAHAQPGPMNESAVTSAAAPCVCPCISHHRCLANIIGVAHTLWAGHEQAGARKVYAVEASAMAEYCGMLKDANPGAGTHCANRSSSSRPAVARTPLASRWWASSRSLACAAAMLVMQRCMHAACAAARQGWLEKGVGTRGLWLAVKTYFSLYLFVWVRAAFPQYPYDQYMIKIEGVIAT